MRTKTETLMLEQRLSSGRWKDLSYLRPHLSRLQTQLGRRSINQTQEPKVRTKLIARSAEFKTEKRKNRRRAASASLGGLFHSPGEISLSILISFHSPLLSSFTGSLLKYFLRLVCWKWTYYIPFAPITLALICIVISINLCLEHAWIISASIVSQDQHATPIIKQN